MNVHEMIKLLPTTEDMMRNAPEGTFPSAVLDAIANINSYYVKSETHSIQITCVDEETTFSKHAHMPQWSVVFSGEAEFTYDNGDVVTYKAGDSYFIENQVAHSAVLSKGYMDVTVLLLDPSLLEK